MIDNIHIASRILLYNSIDVKRRMIEKRREKETM
jgi:hypothetical protein